MSRVLKYKGYIGSIEFSSEDSLFYGKVQGVRTLISYEGDSETALVSDFQGAVDDYLAACKAQGIEPEIAYKGSFNVRIKPDLHRRLALYAFEHGESLNRCAEEAIEALVG